MLIIRNLDISKLTIDNTNIKYVYTYTPQY